MQHAPTYSTSGGPRDDASMLHVSAGCEHKHLQDAGHAGGDDCSRGQAMRGATTVLWLVPACNKHASAQGNPSVCLCLLGAHALVDKRKLHDLAPAVLYLEREVTAAQPCHFWCSGPIPPEVSVAVSACKLRAPADLEAACGLEDQMPVSSASSFGPL